MKNAMKTMTVCCATLALVCCHTPHNAQNGMFVVTSAFVPTVAFGAEIVPTTLPVSSIFTTACPFAPAFRTAFDLVIVPSSTVNLFMDRVTLRLIDGSVVGNPPINFPRPELNQMFGSTLIVGRRAFPFQPQFGCGIVLPQSIAADVVLVDEFGNAHNVTVRSSFRRN